MIGGLILGFSDNKIRVILKMLNLMKMIDKFDHLEVR